MRFFDQVPTRNLLKTKSESFQYVGLCYGVPKGSFSPLLSENQPSRIECETKAKASLFRVISLFIRVVTVGHGWTHKTGIGLRKGYELTLKSMTAMAPSFPNVNAILPSVGSAFHLNIINRTSLSSRGSNGRS